MASNSFFGGQFFEGNYIGTDAVSGNAGHGIPATLRVPARTRKEIERDRERFGIAREVIQSIAESQVRLLEMDAQKQFDELQNELQLRGIELEARHLDALNAERQRLLDAEIELRLQQIMRQRADEQMVLMLLAAAVA